MQRPQRLVSLMTVLTLVVGCSLEFNISSRSGSIDDDYIEEPLSERVSQYRPALELSNRALELLKTAQHERIVTELVATEMQSELNPDALRASQEKVAAAFGPITGYKPMQWGFLTEDYEGEYLLYSVKIVEHEKGMLHYIFVFDADGAFDKLVGLHIKKREGVRPPNQL